MKIHILYSGIILIFILAYLNTNAFQINKSLKSVSNRENKNNTDAKARLLLKNQPDFTADSLCANYEKITKENSEESLKTVKKGNRYRHQSDTFIDYVIPDEPTVRYSFKTKKYDAFSGDVENHLWFTSVESPAILAWDKTLNFEIAGTETVDFEIGGKTEKRELIKIKVTGETTIGGDWDQAVAYLYIAPHLKNLVVKTELKFPTGGRNCTLQNISFTVSERLFKDINEYILSQNNEKNN